ncbi:MAG: hypothetical protein SH817_09615 [Leptospira sp.]|nr:hypothetical protein [Leptospira sp.]
MFSPQSSVIISLLSGVGLVAVVSLAPVRSNGSGDPSVPIQKEKNILFPNINRHPSEGLESDGLSKIVREPDQTEFNLKADMNDSFRSENKIWADTILPSQSEGRFSSIRSQSDWDLYENQNGERKIYFQKDGLVMRGLSNQTSLSSSLSRRDFTPSERFANRRLDAYEVQYAITPSIGAVVQGGNIDQIDDRSRFQRNFAMAGVSIKGGDFFQAKVLTGDTSVTTNQSSNFNFNPLNPNRPNDISRRERDDVKQLYEWQANFTPSDYFKLQTSLYNQRTENSLNMSSPDGGKVSVFVGGKQVQMNLRYNYLTNRNASGFSSNGQTFNPSQDLASLGVVVFLDQSQRYSVYVGNNFYNVLNDPANQIKDASGRSPSTFTASFRGKNPSSSRSSFFLNFQNQFYKDGAVIGLPGVIPISGAQQGKSFYEYATSLGVDVSF